MGAGARCRVGAADLRIPKIEVGRAHEPRVAAAVGRLVRVEHGAVAPQHLAAHNELALHVAVLAGLQDAAGHVGDEISVVGTLGGVAHTDQVVVDVVQVGGIARLQHGAGATDAAFQIGVAAQQVVLGRAGVFLDTGEGQPAIGVIAVGAGVRAGAVAADAGQVVVGQVEGLTNLKKGVRFCAWPSLRSLQQSQFGTIIGRCE